VPTCRAEVSAISRSSCPRTVAFILPSSTEIRWISYTDDSQCLIENDKHTINCTELKTTRYLLLFSSICFHLQVVLMWMYRQISPTACFHPLRCTWYVTSSLMQILFNTVYPASPLSSLASFIQN